MNTSKTKPSLTHRCFWSPLDKTARYLLNDQNDWNQYFHFTVQILYTLIFTGCALFWIVFELAVENYHAALAFCTAVVLGAGSLVATIKLKLVHRWFHLFLLITLGVTSYSNFHTGGPTGPNMVVFIFTMVAAPCALGKTGLVWTLATLGVGAIFKIAQWQGFVFPNHSDLAIIEKDQLYTLISSVTGIVLTLWAYETTRSAAVSKLRASEKALYQAELALRASQKHESIGRLAGGIAHDFNNLLTSIIGCAEIINAEFGTQHVCTQETQDILSAGKRAAKLTQQLLAFSRKQVLQPQAVNLNTVIREMHDMLKRVLGEKINIVTAFDPNLHQASLDVAQMEQVILNLTINAAQAMKNSGTLTLKTYNELFVFQNNSTDTQPSPAVTLQICDTGRGMNREDAQQIFEPFFTTKKTGTGLGLSVVDGIVRQHNGVVEVDSLENQGTTFSIHFPSIAEAESKRESFVGDILTHDGQGQCILVVEDEPSVLLFATKLLSQRGYLVIKATSAEKALQIAVEKKNQIQLIFSDVVLPKMSGLELAAILSKQIPHIPILLTSGYSEDLSSFDNQQDLKWPFIRKPYKPASLLSTISELLQFKFNQANPKST